MESRLVGGAPVRSRLHQNHHNSYSQKHLNRFSVGNLDYQLATAESLHKIDELKSEPSGVVSTAKSMHSLPVTAAAAAPSYSAVVKQSITKAAQPTSTPAPHKSSYTEQPSSDTEMRQHHHRHQSKQTGGGSSSGGGGQHQHHKKNHHNNNHPHNHHNRNNRRRPSQQQLKPFYHANSTPVIGHGSSGGSSSDYQKSAQQQQHQQSPHKAPLSGRLTYNSNNFRKKQL